LLTEAPEEVPADAELVVVPEPVETSLAEGVPEEPEMVPVEVREIGPGPVAVGWSEPEPLAEPVAEPEMESPPQMPLWML